jgi:hypothetical protein
MNIVIREHLVCMVRISDSLRDHVSSSRDSNFQRLGTEKNILWQGILWQGVVVMIGHGLLSGSERFLDLSLT